MCSDWPPRYPNRPLRLRKFRRPWASSAPNGRGISRGRMTILRVHWFCQKTFPAGARINPGIFECRFLPSGRRKSRGENQQCLIIIERRTDSCNKGCVCAPWFAPYAARMPEVSKLRRAPRPQASFAGREPAAWGEKGVSPPAVRAFPERAFSLRESAAWMKATAPRMRWQKRGGLFPAQACFISVIMCASS